MQTRTTTHRGAASGAGRILLVEDEADQAAILEAVLRHEGLEVVVSGSGEQALEAHAHAPADVLVADLNLPGISGVELLRRMGEQRDAPSFVLMTGAGTIASAVEALKLGAADYLQKPLDPMRLVALVRELLASDNVREHERDDDEAFSGPTVFEGMIGSSRQMREVFARIERVATTTAPVLIVGESGTGKELVARAIHAKSRRCQGPFVPVHTGAIPRELIGSELFGHEKGSFTGAFTSAEGKFEAAAGGTIFLDEVSTMDPAVQISLLRVLETYRFTRVGGRKELEADVRIVAATNKDLLELVEDGAFREDLYYRLNVFTVSLPPLRERVEDVIPIAERFLYKFSKRYGTTARRLSDEARARLLEQDWPGNVRELRNVIEQTALFAAEEVIRAEDLQLGKGRIEKRTGRGRASLFPVSSAPPGLPPAEDGAQAPTSTRPPPAHEPSAAATEPEPISTPAPPSPRPSAHDAAPPSSIPPPPSEPVRDHPLVLRLPVGTRLADAERQLILLTLEAVGGNKQRAARVLGISRRGLYSKLQAYGQLPSEEQSSASTPPPEAAADREQT